MKSLHEILSIQIPVPRPWSSQRLLILVLYSAALVALHPVAFRLDSGIFMIGATMLQILTGFLVPLYWHASPLKRQVLIYFAVGFSIELAFWAIILGPIGLRPLPRFVTWNDIFIGLGMFSALRLVGGYLLLMSTRLWRKPRRIAAQAT